MTKNIWVVIPAYNESSRITDVLKKVKHYSKNIVVVDDGSSDETYSVSKKETAHVLRHIINLGKGAALKTGCDFAISQGAEYIAVMDSDGQHEPKEIPHFIKKLDVGSDIVFGYRTRRLSMPFILKFGNWFINRVTLLFQGMNLYDTQCGYRAFTSGAYKKIRWQASDYSMESEMIANAGKHKLKYSQIPISTIYSDKYKGTTVIDGVKIVMRMFWWRVTR